MKFTVILFAALAVAAAAESESSGQGIVPKDDDMLHKLTKWLSFNLPMFAPIRTTPRPRPNSAPRPRPTTAKAPAAPKPPSNSPLASAPSKAPAAQPPSNSPLASAPSAPPAEQPPSNSPLASASEAPSAPAPTDATNHLPQMDPMMALEELYKMDGLKDMLPPLSDIMNPDPSKPDPMQKPVGEVADEFTMNLMQSILAFISSRPSGSVNLDDPITLTSDGKLA